MTKNCNLINVTALKRLPEKHYAHENWSPKQKTTQILTHQKKETGKETNISMCNLSASTNTSSTYTINSKSSIHISWSKISQNTENYHM